jgi:hypothetical protein
MSDARIVSTAMRRPRGCLLSQTVPTQLRSSRRWPFTWSPSRRYQSVSTQTPVPEPHSEPTVPCDSCGRDTPAPAPTGSTVGRARCAECEIAVAQALDELMRQLVGPRTDADTLPLVAPLSELPR